MTKIKYKSVELFGGAITASLPKDFADASNFRQIPDNQEVYLCQTGLSSIVIEVTERVQPPDHPCKTDEEAFLYHYQDLIAADYGREKDEGQTKETTRVWDKSKTELMHLKDVPAYTLFATQTYHAEAQSEHKSKSQPDFTGIILTMIRLEKQQSDLLISINVPHASGEYDPEQISLEQNRPGPALADAKSHMSELLQTFNVRDWNLFSTE